MKGKKEIIIGLCVLIALGVLYFGVEFLKGVNVFKPSNAYTASYTNVAGLQVSAPVTINGLKVGQVSSIEYEYDNPGHVKVAFSLDKALQVPAGSKAVIEQDLLGTASVVLHFTDAKEYVPRGSSLEGLTSAGLMGDVSEKLLPSVDRIMNQVDTLLTNLNTVMGDPAIHSSVQRLDQITLSIEQTMRQLNTTVGALPQHSKLRPGCILRTPQRTAARLRDEQYGGTLGQSAHPLGRAFRPQLHPGRPHTRPRPLQQPQRRGSLA